MEGIQELIGMADAGDVKAQEKVAVAYLKGNGTEKDLNKALEYFKMCAENGSGLGNYQLGKAYENGNGVEMNMDIAITYYKKSAELGYANAKNVLSQLENSEQQTQAEKPQVQQGSGYIPPSAPVSNIPKFGEASNFGGKQKSKVVAAVLAFVFGSFGAHNFYMGFTKKAIIQLVLTITVIGAPISQIWALIECFMVLTGNINCDAKGHSLK